MGHHVDNRDGGFADHLRTMVPAQAIVDQFLQSFKDYPARAKSGISASIRCCRASRRAAAAAVIRFHTRGKSGGLL
jgi:hypothetical protein